MADDRYDIPDIPDVPGEGGGGDGGGGGRSRRRWPWLLTGVVLGGAAVLLLPRYVGPYLPDFLGMERLVIRGQVIETERQEERLLLTVDSHEGALLVTFRQRVDEIALLVSEGDSIFLRTREFRPFLESPELVGVRKGRWEARGRDVAADSLREDRPRDAAGGASDTAPGDTPAAGGEAAEPAAPDTTPAGGASSEDAIPDSAVEAEAR